MKKTKYLLSLVLAASLTACSNPSGSTDEKTTPAPVETPEETKVTLGGAPTEVKATTLNSKPAISWKAVTGATKYIVYWNVKNDSATATAETLKEEDIELLKRTNQLSFENDVYTYQVFLQRGNGNYYFWVKAGNDTETSDFSSVAKVTKGNLAAPTGLTVTQSNSTKNKVKITFNKESGYHYRLYESTTNDFSTAKMLTYMASKNDEFTATSNGTHYYWLTITDGTANAGYAESDPSEVVSVDFTRDELKTPSITSAILGTDNKTVTVNWTKVDTKNPGKFLLYYIYDEGKIIETPSITNATLLVLDGSATSKKIENLGKGYFHWWILEADDDPTIYENTAKSTAKDIPETMYN